MASEGLLHHEEGLHDARLARVVRAGQDRQRAHGDALLVVERLEALDGDLGDARGGIVPLFVSRLVCGSSGDPLVCAAVVDTHRTF